MQSFLHSPIFYDSGYFHVWISSSKQQQFFHQDVDKAFFMTLLQDILSPRAKLQEFTSTPRHCGSEIDLLAFSLTETDVHLLVHTSRKEAIDEFGQLLLLPYAQYLHTTYTHQDLPFDTLFIFDRLKGRHEALHVSREIHLLHDDWRGDRYSSIGFYLNDRRGDWMRPYRITSLFLGKSRQYLRFLKSQETESDRIFEYIQT